MEAVCELLRNHGYEMHRNQIADILRDKNIGVGNGELKVVLESLVGGGHITYRRDGQKIYYSFEQDFIVNDVKPWTPNE